MTDLPFPGFEDFLGNRRAVEILRRSIEQDRLPHAMIFAGPAGIGKRTLAILIAQVLNCLSPLSGGACQICESCKKIAAGNHADVSQLQPDGAYIKIDQVRALISEVAYQPFEGRYRVVILDGADQMRVEAANSLLKTLEEPASRTILILVTTNPYVLLGTIRSRARILHFGPISHEQIVQYLIQKRGIAPAEAELASTFSQGSLGAALSFNAVTYQAARTGALRFVTLLLQAGTFTEASSLASTLAKDKESFTVWLELAMLVLRDVYYAQVAPGRVVRHERGKEIEDLSRRSSRKSVVSAFQSLNRLRRALLHNVNRQIALESVFLENRS